MALLSVSTLTVLGTQGGMVMRIRMQFLSSGTKDWGLVWTRDMTGLLEDFISSWNMKDVLKESSKEIRKGISCINPEDKVIDHSFLFVMDGFILCLLIISPLTLRSALVGTINYIATLPKGRHTELWANIAYLGKCRWFIMAKIQVVRWELWKIRESEKKAWRALLLRGGSLSLILKVMRSQ